MLHSQIADRIEIVGRGNICAQRQHWRSPATETMWLAIGQCRSVITPASLNRDRRM